MKKRIMALLTALTMIVVGVGCGKGYKIGDNGEVYNDYIKIKKWKEFEVERVDPTPVTDEEVALSIESDLQTLAETVDITDRAATMGDQVVIDYVGKLDGVAFDRGSDNDYVMILGEAGFIDGFETGIVGHKPGETFDLPLTFPKDYGNADLAGKAVVFTITLDKIQEVVVPELTDETVVRLSDKVKTIDEYKAQVKADLEKSNQEEAEYQMKSNLLSALLEQCEVIEYPEKELEEAVKSMTEYMDEQLEYAASSYGMTTEAYMEAIGYTDELLKETIEEYAKDNLRTQYALELVLDVEDISHTEKDYKNFIKEEAERQGVESSEEVEEFLESYYGPGGAELYFLQMKVADFLWGNCTIVEPTEAETVTE